MCYTALMNLANILLKIFQTQKRSAAFSHACEEETESSMVILRAQCQLRMMKNFQRQVLVIIVQKY